MTRPERYNDGMPLSKARDRERKRLQRHPLVVQPNSNLTTNQAVQPKLAALRGLIHSIESGGHKSVQPTSNLDNELPWYDSSKHGPGTKVRVRRYGRTIIAVVPELDADGQPAPMD